MTDYVDAGEAIPFAQLSNVKGVAPATGNVDYERILGARSEPQNWLTYYGTYDGQRYSDLDQINKDTVKRLSPAWVFQAGAVGMQSGASTYSFEASPLVVEGVMYVSGPDGRCWAIDAKTGEELWRYKANSPYDVSLCCGNVNRGVAVGHGKVYMLTLNAHLIALDATTGVKVWDVVNGDVRAGESGSAAPLIVKDMVICGSAGGEFGTRGHLDAFDAQTGERRWRRYMVPKPGEPGSETWPDDGEAWQRGGANCWVTPTYDPELELLYQGTGNPAPDFDGAVRMGDNLYTDSTVAVDVNTGEIRWHYQFTPHDLWDYDSTMENVLFDAPDGRKLLGHADKNGYFFTLDRTNGELVKVFPFVDRITWGEIAPDGTVTPKVYPDEEGVPVHFWPG
ncbi:MAG: PQQ-binding-like beta-propeller repeat protein, partial [Pseudonocardia sp.]|nr:PQQ-binding-like beta-propeller repeat protein [Pseudonocardia sp.]